MARRFHSDDVVVYQKHKRGTHPTSRAHDVRPASSGDDYDYVVDKYWLVVDVAAGGRLKLRTPGGKLHEVASDDPCLRPPSLRERLSLRLWNRGRLRALRQPGA
jgi:hypothetical protein